MTHLSHQAAIVTGYEMNMSRWLKEGSDIWLNTPRRPREASGTSGMTAAMNGSVNLSTDDGWIPEFAKHGKNSYVIPAADLPDRSNVSINNLIHIFDLSLTDYMHVRAHVLHI